MILLLVIVFGVVGFMLTEHYNFLDAFYVTIVTIATIGFQEAKPLTTGGKIFYIIYILASFTVFTYALGKLTRYIVSGEMKLYFKNRKLMNAINKINNHVIICGFGRNGQQAAHTLLQHKTDFVVIDKNENHFVQWLEEHTSLIYLRGDATDDDLLLKAGIKKAKAILLTLPTDADNVFIVLSAKSINPQIQIISRASQTSSVNKLKTAGADHVILPDKIGGTHMATLISKPDVIEFINNLWGDEADTINIESIDYEAIPQPLKDKSIQEIINTQRTNVNCIGIKDKEGRFIINPSLQTLIHPQMKIILLGNTQQIKSVKEYFKEHD